MLYEIKYICSSFYKERVGLPVELSVVACLSLFLSGDLVVLIWVLVEG